MTFTISDEILDGLIGDAKTHGDLFGEGGLIKALSKRLMERMLEAEMTHHLGYEKHAPEGRNTGNSRNGKTSKTVIRVVVRLNWIYHEIGHLSLNPCLWVNAKQNWIH